MNSMKTTYEYIGQRADSGLACVGSSGIEISLPELMTLVSWVGLLSATPYFIQLTHLL